MPWLIKLFVRKRVLDFVQNYLDCPANWKLDNTRTYCLINKKHDLAIELSTNRKRIYRFHPATSSMDQNDLNVIERRLLLHTFKGPCESTKDIPTKATHPEEFI